MRSSHLSKRRLLATNCLCAAFVGLVIFIVSGCARQPRLDVDVISTSKLPEEITKLLGSHERIKTFRAYAEAEFSIRGYTQRVDLAIVAMLPDKIRIDFVDRLAGSVATLVSKPGYSFYRSSKGLYLLDGEEADDIFKKVSMLPWGRDDVIGALVGKIPFSSQLSEDGQYPRDSKGRYWISEDEAAVSMSGDGGVEYIETNRGRLKSSLRYNDYKKSGKILYPSEVSLVTHRPVGHVKLKYKDVVFNGRVSSRLFDQIE